MTYRYYNVYAAKNIGTDETECTDKHTYLPLCCSHMQKEGFIMFLLRLDCVSFKREFKAF